MLLSASGTLRGNSVRYNQAGTHGGGLVLNASDPTMQNNVISRNVAAQLGGGILVQAGSTPTMLNNTINGNRAVSGGGIAWFNSGGLWTGNQVGANVASGSGGGMMISASNPQVLDGQIFNNVATNFGGGILIQANSQPLIANHEIRFNRAGSHGGGIQVSSSQGVIRNNTIMNNAGEGIDIVASQSVNLTENIITANTAGVRADQESRVTLVRNNVWNNNGADYRNIAPGSSDLSLDPLFVVGPFGCCYLSQRAAGQARTSPLVDAGTRTAPSLGLDRFTTRTDGVGDQGLVDLGVHYPLFSGRTRVWLPYATSSAQ